MVVEDEMGLSQGVEEAEGVLGAVRDASTFARDDLLKKRLERALDKSTQAVIVHDVAKIAAEYSAVDLAIVASCLPPSARAILFEHFSTLEEKIKFLIHAESTTRISVFREISDSSIISVIAQMPPDEAVEVLEDLSERRYKKVLEGLDVEKALRIKQIEKNARNTAGRLMTNEFFAFSMEATVKEVSFTIRNNPGIDLTRRIFVLNAEGELQGYVPERNLIINPPDLPLKQVMRPVLHKVFEGQSREEVVEVVERYKISALPVVSENNRLVGVITYEDVLDTLADMLDETIGNVAGTNEKVSGNESAFRRLLSRSPWLIVTLCAGLINVGVMSSFESLQRGILTFALFFVPLITGMSGNIGIQCSTVLVRSMAIGVFNRGNRRSVLFKELLTGCMAGLFFGVLCGSLVYAIDFSGFGHILTRPWVVGAIVGLGLMGACVAGTLLGVLSPLFFCRVGVDPAVASGPIVTAFNDLLSMSIYFLIATCLSSLFL